MPKCSHTACNKDFTTVVKKILRASKIYTIFWVINHWNVIFLPIEILVANLCWFQKYATNIYVCLQCIRLTTDGALYHHCYMFSYVLHANIFNRFYFKIMKNTTYILFLNIFFVFKNYKSVARDWQSNSYVNFLFIIKFIFFLEYHTKTGGTFLPPGLCAHSSAAARRIQWLSLHDLGFKVRRSAQH